MHYPSIIVIIDLVGNDISILLIITMSIHIVLDNEEECSPKKVFEG